MKFYYILKNTCLKIYFRCKFIMFIREILFVNCYSSFSINIVTPAGMALILPCFAICPLTLRLIL